MSKLILSYGSQLKQLTVGECQSPSYLIKLLRSTFQTKQDILGVTDSCGKFYDLQYASENIKTLNNHKLNIVTAKDAGDNMSFGSGGSSRNSFSRNTTLPKCLGKINDISKFKKNMPQALVVILTLNEQDLAENIPFQYYLARGSRRWLEIWDNNNLLLECQIGENHEQLYRGVSRYLKQMAESDQRFENPTLIMNDQIKQSMILESLESLLEEGAIAEIEFYKKKIVLFQRPKLYINKFFTGETVDRSELTEKIRRYINSRREEVRILGVVSDSPPKHDIPIFVRKGSNRIEKVSSEHPLSLEQEQVLNLLMELQLKGLITEKEMEAYQKIILKHNTQVLSLARDFYEKEFDQLELARRLRKLLSDKRKQKY